MPSPPFRVANPPACAGEIPTGKYLPTNTHWRISTDEKEQPFSVFFLNRARRRAHTPKPRYLDVPTEENS